MTEAYYCLAGGCYFSAGAFRREHSWSPLEQYSRGGDAIFIGHRCYIHRLTMLYSRHENQISDEILRELPTVWLLMQ